MTEKIKLMIVCLKKLKLIVMLDLISIIKSEGNLMT